MGIKNFVERFQQFCQHMQGFSQKAQEFAGQQAPNLSNFCGSIFGS